MNPVRDPSLMHHNMKKNSEQGPVRRPAHSGCGNTCEAQFASKIYLSAYLIVNLEIPPSVSCL